MSADRDVPGFVYFVEATEVNRIKIGYSARDPEEKRFWDLRNGSPVPLRLLGSIPGTRKTEQTLHARFARLRAYGEWFDAAAELRSFIAGREDLILPRLPASVELVARKPAARFEERSRKVAVARRADVMPIVDEPEDTSPRAAAKTGRRKRWSDDPGELKRQIEEMEAIFRHVFVD